MKRAVNALLLCSTCLLLSLYSCTKPAKSATWLDQLVGVYIGPDSILAGAGAPSVVIDTLTVARYDTVTTGALLNGMFQYITPQADGSLLSAFGSDRNPADDYFYTFYPAQHRVVYRQELQYIDSTVVIRRGVFYLR